MITFRYKDPTSGNFLEKDLDENEINVPGYLKNFHLNVLCKNECNGENCKIWIKMNNEFILVGVES